MEYIPGDPILIKNIVTKFKSQGIFDQIRKECIADVDTKPAYQNLCHRADNQVSKILSKVKWGPDLHKNQTRENIRRQINECSFVEPGIAIIVDQLVNPRINTEIVPKVEDMLYKFLGIPVENLPSQREPKNDRNFSKNVSDCEVPGMSSTDMYDKRRETDGSENHYRTDNQKSNGISTLKYDSSTNKTQSSGDKYNRDKSSSVKIDPFDALLRDSKSMKTEPEKHYPDPDLKTSPFSEFDTDSSDDEMSPPFEPHVKSDNDMSIGSGDSNFSEIIETRPPNEPEIPGVDDQIDDLCKIDDSKIIAEHEDSLDSVQSSYSTAPEPELEPMTVPAPTAEPETELEVAPAPVPTPVSDPEPEKVHISPIEIPKTPTINYETSDDSDDYVKNKKLQDNVAVDPVEPLEVPEVNFDKIVENVIENSADGKALPCKEEDKSKDKKRSDDAKTKTPTKHKDDKSGKPVDTKDKHFEKKSDHRSDKDRKYDKHRSEGRSKDREKEKPKHDSSKIHSRKDDKSHHSRDHSKSDYDRKSKSEHKKDDGKKDDKKDSGRSDHKKDDKNDHRKDAKSDRKKEDDKKHSRDDKDRKRDPHKSGSSDDKKSSKPRVEDSKHKYPDKPRDDKKSSKNSDHHKSKKKPEDPKKSRSHCNLDEKKKTDRRSSDRDSSGPSTSNSSSLHHTSSQHSSKSDKDKGSSKHRHSSSSSSHKTKRNDSEHDKSRSEKQSNGPEKNPATEDDLEMILESSPDKAFQNSVKSEANFSSRKILANQSDQSSDHIEDMMNEMFQPTKPVLKKPKIAKNFADIRRIMKLRKLYEEDFKLKECPEQNANESITDADKSTMYKIKLRKTVDYFVMRRFGKNGNNREKCKELTNAIIETLTDVKLNITRVDRRYSLVDGSCTLTNDENSLTVANNVADGKNNVVGAKSSDSEDIENIPIIEDERANLILEDLANSYTDPNFKLGNVPTLLEDPPVVDKPPQQEEDTLKIIQSEIKANGAKTRLPTKLTPAENDDKSNPVDEPSIKTKPEEDDSSPSLKLKIKSILDGKNMTWRACDRVDHIEDPVHYFPLPEYNSAFMQYINGVLNEEYDFEVQNLAIEMDDYPECFDYMFANFLGAKVLRPKPDDAKTSPIKYNSQIISKKLGDKSIMLRIKKSSESEELLSNDPAAATVVDQKILNRKRKLADDSGVELDPPEVAKDEAQPVKKKKKTLGIKRSFVNPLKMKLTSGQLNCTAGSDNMIENVTAVTKPKSSPVPKKMPKLSKSKEMAAANANHKKSESESSDGRRSSVSSSGTSSTHSKGINESATAPPSSPAPAPAPSKSKKNIALNDSKTDTIETNAVEGPTTTKTADPPPPPPSKKPIDTKTAEEKRKQIIMKSYYDESDLYKPRPSLRLTSRRYRVANTENGENT